jgi:electron transfer flavoprotein alpha subunit
MQVLVVAEIQQGALKSATRAAIAFARKLATASSSSFSVLAIGGPGTRAAAEQLRAFGAQKVYVAEDSSFQDYVAERYAPTTAQLAKDFTVVCATASSFGKDLMPRVAAQLDAAYAGDCAGVSVEDGRPVYKRPMYAGNVFGHVKLLTPIHVVTVRQSEFDAAEPSGGESPMQEVAIAPASAAASRVEFVTFEAVKNERPELTDAGVIVSGGRALKEHFFSVLEPLADRLGAAIGASRAACDAGYAPGDFQVGQTGKIVAPRLYFAIGISGAIQHIAGMKGSKTIVAINKDPDAPIFQIADYGLVADLFQAVPELVQALGGSGSSP